MHHLIDSNMHKRSLLTALDGRIKLVLTLATLLVNLSAMNWRVSCGLALVAWLLVLLAGVPQRRFLRRMVLPLVFALVALLTQLFWVKSGNRIDIVGVTIYSGGLLVGFELASRILGGMATLLFFALTTPLPELMRAARAFRCPPVLVELTLIMYRYIFLLLEEGGRIRTAQRSRAGYANLRAGMRSSSVLGGMLLLRTYDRAERSFEAMRCRGYRGALSSPPETGISVGEWQTFAVGMVMLGGLYLIG